MALSRKPTEIVEDSKNPLLVKHESWERVPVGDIADILNGFAFKSSKFTKDKGMPLIRIRDVGKDASETYYDGEFDEAYLVNDGDLLVGMDGDFRAAIWKGGKALLNQRVCKISLKTDEYDFKFLSYVLQPYLDAIHAETSAVTVKHLSSRSISEIPLPLPPKEQQKRIVAKIEELFSHIDAGIEALKKAKQLLKQYRQSVLKAAVTGELTKEWREANKDKLEPASQLLERILKERRQKWEEQQLEQFKAKGKILKDDNWKEKYREPTDPECLLDVKLPSAWESASLDKLSIAITSGSRDWKKYYGKGTGIFILAQNVRPGRLDLSEKQYVDPPQNSPDAIRSEVEKGDLLITIVGANTGDVCNVKEDLNQHYVCQSVALVRSVIKDISKFILLYLLSEECGRKQFKKYIYGQGRPHLSFDQLKQTEIALPPIEEQEEIIFRFGEKSELISRVESEVNMQLIKAEKNKQSILASAFSGKLNISNIDYAKERAAEAELLST